MLGIIGKPLARRGARAWFRIIWTYGVKVIEFQSFRGLKKIEKYVFFFTMATTQGILALMIKCPQCLKLFGFNLQCKLATCLKTYKSFSIVQHQTTKMRPPSIISQMLPLILGIQACNATHSFYHLLVKF